MQYSPLFAFILAAVFTPTRQESVPQFPTDEQLKIMRKTSLDWHNIFRAWHHSPPLKLDEELNEAAQAYATKLASLDKPKPKHSESDDRKHNGGWVGENMGWMKAAKGGKEDFKFQYEAEKVAKLWYVGEYCDPKYKRTEFDHWTQVLWKSTKLIGFGAAYSYKRDNSLNNLYIVARYYPAGNIQGTCSDGKTSSEHNLFELRCKDAELCPAKKDVTKFSSDYKFKVAFLDNIPKRETKCPARKSPPSVSPAGSCDDNEPEIPDDVAEDPDEEVGVLCEIGGLLCSSTSLKPIGFGLSILIVVVVALAF